MERMAQLIAMVQDSGRCPSPAEDKQEGSLAKLALMDQGAPSVSFTRAKTAPPEGASRLREDERGAATRLQIQLLGPHSY